MQKPKTQYRCPDCGWEKKTRMNRVRCSGCGSLNLERELESGKMLKADMAEVQPPEWLRKVVLKANLPLTLPFVPEYIDYLKDTGKIGGPGYEKWVQAGRPMYSENIGFRYEDW